MSSRITFSEALMRKYLVESKAILTHLKACNNGKAPDWKDLTKLFLLEFVRHLKSQISANSARTYCALIKSLLNDYKEAVKIPCSTKDYSKILSIKKVGTKNIYLDDNEIRLLIDYVPVSELEHTVRNQFVFSCLTGMRHSDAVKIDKNNLNEKSIFFLSDKTNSIVNSYTCDVVENYLKEAKNHIYSDVTFNKTIRSICEKVGIRQQAKIIKAGKEITGLKYQFVTSHTGRRSFATNLYKATKDIYLVSRLMGHSDTKITETYICIDLNQNEAVLDYFSKYNISGN